MKTILPYKSGTATSLVRVDTALGLHKLFRNPKKLQKYNIVLDPGRPKNKNSNSIVDKRIRELEEELKKLSPDGDALDENVLVLATKFLNEKIRQHGFSSHELMFRRKQDSNQELDLKDEVLKEKVFEKRLKDHLPSAISKATIKKHAKKVEVIPGQIGFIKQEGSKHQVRPAYFVT